MQANGIYIDSTYGRGGHSAAILQRLGARGRLFALDKDPAAVDAAVQRHGAEARFHIEQGNFAHLGEYAERYGIHGQVAGILLDLGLSSPQVDEAARGFSFLRDGPLDMRMNPQQGRSVADWLAEASAEEIAAVLWRYGEERQAKRLARCIVEERCSTPITRTGQLATLIARMMPRRTGDKHPATRSFQALRIFINNELDDLRAGLSAALATLAPAGRLVVISFHSLEDRIVKQFIRAQERGPSLPRGLPIIAVPHVAILRAIGKPIFPSAAEVAGNPRARSAVLRVAQKS